MRVVTFEVDGKARPGVLNDADGVFDLSTEGFSSMLEVIEAASADISKIRKFVADPSMDSAYTLGTVKLIAPIPRPRKLICVGLNYREHAIETGTPIPETPTIFNKFATAVIGTGGQIVHPKVSKSQDY